MTHDPNARLDTGMKVTEAISLASRWWDKSGRHAIPANFNIEQTVKTRPSTGKFPAIAIRSQETVLPANILNGVPWDGLTDAERRQIVRVYHHFFVRVPQAEAPQPTATDQVLAMECDWPGHDPSNENADTFRGPTQINVHHQAQAAGWYMTSTVDYCPACHMLMRAEPQGTA